MVQIVEQQGGLFGRLGKGVGEGLSEQLPKEMDRYRLSQGLKQFEQESKGLSPLEQYSRLASIPGVTPAMLQAFPELLKQQTIRDAYAKKAGKRSTQETDKQDFKQAVQAIKDVNFSNLDPQANRQRQASQEIVRPEEFGQPQIVDKNPLRQEAIPRKPWKQERLNEEIARNFEEFSGINFQESVALAKEAEARELAQPEAEQAIDNYHKEQQKEIIEKFRDQLGTKLEKDPEGNQLYQDVNGEMLINLERGLEKELRTNPKASVDDVVNKWTKKALDLAKAKKQMDALSGSSRWATPILLNKESYRDKLKEYSDIFSKAENSEEYFHKLQSDFSMSPSGASSLAYPRNENLKKYISSVKPQKVNEFSKYPQTSRKYASEIENSITSKDSILAIARDLQEKDPYFDQKSFFEQLSEDKDRIGLTERQRREIAEGTSGILPSWGDILILPFFRGIQ